MLYIFTYYIADLATDKYIFNCMISGDSRWKRFKTRVKKIFCCCFTNNDDED